MAEAQRTDLRRARPSSLRSAPLALVLVAAPASAQIAISEHATEPERSEPAPAPVPEPEEPTAGDVANAPIPGHESGRVDDVETDSTGNQIARAFLLGPKLLVEAAMLPMRTAVWASDRYDIEGHYYELMYNHDRTIGIDPVASYQSGFGGLVGARFNDLDLAGDHELLAVQTAWDGVDHQSHALTLRSGDRFGNRLHLSLDGNFDRRPSDSFWGYGNDTPNVATPHRYSEMRSAFTTEVRVARRFSAMVHTAVAQVGTDDVTASHAYGELELRYDDRRPASWWEPQGLHAQGSMVSVFAGRVARLDDQPSFWRYGAELQHYFRIAQGPRMLILRARGEAITGPLMGVPFEEVPALGGDTFLRGYDYGRFRDRIATFGSVQYQWDLSRYFDAYLFSDAGRVYPSFGDLTLADMRLGYGVGIEMHDWTGHFMIEGALASSIDGGVVFNVSFNPVVDARPRWR